jgi:SNF2 family DNA or RNA helicase
VTITQTPTGTEDLGEAPEAPVGTCKKFGHPLKQGAGNDGRARCTTCANAAKRRRRAERNAVRPDRYREFLAEKVNFNSACGFEISDEEIHPILKPHQRAIVHWAVSGGRRAIFASFGLGKGVMQLETLRLVLDHLRPSQRGLIICPLGVRQEFKRDAAMLGIPIAFVRRTDEVAEAGKKTNAGIFLTNYESVRDGKLDPTVFDVVSLDEASVLRSYGSKTYQTFLTLFDQVPYRFVATATPSPNRYKELIQDGVKYLQAEEASSTLPTLFDAEDLSA